eukprot:TRINITY_DN2461_c0_g1_i5.p3 TRINITY_DN2461_c0_g1~~TRINITY_DN2461_c0_g1_i5.p3  ORF type:complete len:134 (-),score=2.88 TRINITY_DN2461_c0_g1_i5:265-666(-)
MSTAGGENNYFPQIFTGHRKRTGHLKKLRCFTSPVSLSPGKLLPGTALGCQKEKRTLSRACVDVSEFICVTTSGVLPPIHLPVEEYQPHSLSATAAGALHFNTELTYALGPTDPRPNTVHVEPFLASVFKVLI